VKARPLLLLLTCAGLAWLAADGDAATRDAAPPHLAGPAAPDARPVVLAALPAQPAGPWPEQVERPLFAPGRRPPAPPAAPAAVEAPPPEPPPPVAASGVVLRPAGSLALVRLADERVVRATEGERIEGWLVARIDAEGVEFSRGDERLRLPVRARAAEGVLRH
jgi:general secretion pathway protein N